MSEGQRIIMIGQKSWLAFPVTQKLTLIFPGEKYPYRTAWLIEPRVACGREDDNRDHDHWLGRHSNGEFTT